MVSHNLATRIPVIRNRRRETNKQNKVTTNQFYNFCFQQKTYKAKHTKKNCIPPILFFLFPPIIKKRKIYKKNIVYSLKTEKSYFDILLWPPIRKNEITIEVSFWQSSCTSLSFFLCALLGEI